MSAGGEGIEFVIIFIHFQGSVCQMRYTRSFLRTYRALALKTPHLACTKDLECKLCLFLLLVVGSTPSFLSNSSEAHEAYKLAENHNICISLLRVCVLCTIYGPPLSALYLHLLCIELLLYRGYLGFLLIGI